MTPKLYKKHDQVACPDCDTVPLQTVEKDIITEVQYHEGNGYPKAKVIFPAYLHCAFCHSDFTLRKERI